MTPGTVDWPFCHLGFHLDANRANADPSNRSASLDQLELWRDRGVIALEWPRPAYEEAQRGDLTGDRKRKIVGSSLVAEPYLETREEMEFFRAIESVVFPGCARDDNERADVLNLFTAKKYGRHFVTDDGSTGKRRGILTQKQKLKTLGVSAMTDADALRMVHEQLARRAALENGRAQQDGRPVSAWVGRYEDELASNPRCRGPA